MSAPAIVAAGVGKRYAGSWQGSVRLAASGIARELTARPPRRADRPGEFWALSDLSFEIGAGEAVAILGRNGAGKSTLLRLLSGLIKPDRGVVRVAGRLGTLLELGVGFNPVLTAGDNIALSAAAAGLSRRDAEQAADAILAFAELEDHLEAPLKHFSSGMAARLAFSVAAHLHPDVLLIDEAIAVGDYAFQRKCIAFLRRFTEEGGTLVLVTHNVFLAHATCGRALVLDDGLCAFDGSTTEAIGAYLLLREERAVPASGARGKTVAGPAIRGMSLAAEDGGPLRTAAAALVTLDYEDAPPSEVLWGFALWSGDHSLCVTGELDTRPRRVDGAARFVARIPELPLMAGVYELRGYVVEPGSWAPITTLGYAEGEPPVPVTVTAPADRRLTSLAVNQLVTIDVEWR